MTYTAVATRQMWQRVALCDGVSVTYDWSVESGPVLLCRALRDAGKPDGEMQFTDDTGFSQRIASIHQWADHQPTYRGSFRRSLWFQSGDIRIEPAYFENGLVKLCRALRDSGKPDGDLLMIEAVGRLPLRCYAPSIYQRAADRLISEADQIALQAKQEARTRPGDASADEDKPAPVKVKRISEDWYRLLMALKGGNLAPWKAVHPLTKTALATNGYTDGDRITAAGEEALAQYENPYRDMTPAELTDFAATVGLVVNGNASHLAETLIAIDKVIAVRSLADVETMATRSGLTVRYGKGKKGEPLKKRLNLVALINAGHQITL